MQEVKKITVLVPLYNEVQVLPELIKRLDDLMVSTNFIVNVLFVEDGSTDETAQLLIRSIFGKTNYSAIFLSRNFGHAMALTAGLSNIEADTDAVFIIDGDLQDPPELLEQFLLKMNEGNDVVYGIRKKRKETFFKKFMYKFYYRFLKQFSNINIPLDAGDFSLISKRVVIQMNNLPEESRYLRGLRSWVGFKQCGIEYERDERKAGDSKYGIRSLFKLAFNGIFNFSEMPIRLIGIVGFFTIFISLVYLSIIIYKKLVYGTVPEGFTTLIFAIVLFSGVQLFSIGILGEYILRIFFQVKQRPLFIVRAKIIKGETILE
jgi:polyisoprenyl-phosphate glycosyltransferase